MSMKNLRKIFPSVPTELLAGWKLNTVAGRSSASKGDVTIRPVVDYHPDHQPPGSPRNYDVVVHRAKGGPVVESAVVAFKMEMPRPPKQIGPTRPPGSVTIPTLPPTERVQQSPERGARRRRNG